MVAFLQKILVLVLSPILNFLIEKVVYSVKEYVRQRQARKEIEDANRSVRESSEKAVTKEERDEAARKVISRF